MCVVTIIIIILIISGHRLTPLRVTRSNYSEAKGAVDDGKRRRRRRRRCCWHRHRLGVPFGYAERRNCKLINSSERSCDPSNLPLSNTETNRSNDLDEIAQGINIYFTGETRESNRHRISQFPVNS